MKYMDNLWPLLHENIMPSNLCAYKNIPKHPSGTLSFQSYWKPLYNAKYNEKYLIYTYILWDIHPPTLQDQFSRI